MPRLPCDICKWRHFVLAQHEDDDEDDSPDSHSEAEYEHPARRCILNAFHTKPNAMWMRILQTNKLCAGFTFRKETFDTRFFCTPLRAMRPRSEHATRHSDVEVCMNVRAWEMFGNLRYEHTDVINGVWHFTKIEHLVGGSIDLPEGFGILVEGGLRYGHCTHNGNSGVNFNSVFNDYLLTRGYVGLELNVVDSTRLKGGMKCRHCVRGVPGEIAYKVEVTRLVFCKEDVPPIVLVT